jgi:PTH1 family peptidyl-tRNA hydrolase
MKLIFAQGNPGAQYAKSRHNVGWICLDTLAAQQGVSFIQKPKFFAEIAELPGFQEKALLVKPTTFYNETGRAVRAMCDFYKITAADILVLHDDLALPFGAVRIRQQGSDGGNNGIKSVTAHMGEHYTRIRIGIAPRTTESHSAKDYVLAPLTASETQAMTDYIAPAVLAYVSTFVTQGSLEAHSVQTLPPIA